MKRTALFLLGLTLSILTYGQTIKIQGGTSISNLDWQVKGMNSDPLYNESVIGYSIFAGIDYLDKQYFNLESNIGIIRKGGKDEFQLYNPNGELTDQTVIEKPTLDYLSINTMVDLKYRIKETITPFISVGPRLDYLVSNSEEFDALDEMDELQKISIGLILGGGLKYDVSDLQFGIRADYYLDFTKVADWTVENTGFSGEVTTNTFTLNLSIGYRL